MLSMVAPKGINYVPFTSQALLKYICPGLIEIRKLSQYNTAETHRMSTCIKELLAIWPHLYLIIMPLTTQK